MTAGVSRPMLLPSKTLHSLLIFRPDVTFHVELEIAAIHILLAQEVAHSCILLIETIEYRRLRVLRHGPEFALPLALQRAFHKDRPDRIPSLLLAFPSALHMIVVHGFDGSGDDCFC